MACYRCGSCCRNYLCVVPKNIDSDLSEGFLYKLAEKHGYDYMHNYIEANIIPQGKKCIWLKQNNHIKENNKIDIAVCTAYDRKSSNCSEYMKDDYCVTGLRAWKVHQDNGHKIPSEIMKELKKHPWYTSVFKVE